MVIVHHWGGTMLPESEQSTASISLEKDRVVVRATAALPLGVHAPDKPVGFTDGLWEYDVFEVFAVAPDGTYIEIEFGPRGHWLVYWFSSYRERMTRTFDHAMFVYESVLEDQIWRVGASFPSDWLPGNWSELRWNIYQIRRRTGAGEYDYLAWKSDPTIAPDFHQTKCFALLGDN